MAAGPKRVLLLVLMTCATLLFTALGVWQVERRAGKLALIAAVAARAHASPVTAPPPARWPAMTTKTDEYRHIFAEGTLLRETSERTHPATPGAAPQFPERCAACSRVS